MGGGGGGEYRLAHGLLRVRVFVWLFLSCYEMIVGRWYVQLVVICHWYLPLCNFLFFIYIFF